MAKRILLYNPLGIMFMRSAFWVTAILSVGLASCGGPANRPLVDPTAFRLPLAEAGSLEIEGTVAGQPRSRAGVVFFATREGFLTAVIVPARQVLWRFKAESPVSVSPEIGDGHILLRDDGNVVYVLDFMGTLVLRKQLGEAVTSAVRGDGGRIYFGTAGGKAVALDLSAGGAQVWAYAGAAAVTSGPVFAGDMAMFGAADGKLIALDKTGKLMWEFLAKGAIAVDPAAAEGRLYFGTGDRHFYCLRLATGKRIWSRRLQGSPIHPALIRGRRLALAASNSVVYFLSGRGGAILSWEAVPSRIVHEISDAGALVLVSSSSPSLVAVEFASGKRIGEHAFSGPLAAGALWASPFVILVAVDAETGGQRLVILGPRPAS